MKVPIRIAIIALVLITLGIGWARPTTPVIGFERLGLVKHIPSPGEPVWLSGTVESTSFQISSETTGRLISLSPREGDSLAVGQELGHIDDEVAKAQLRQSEMMTAAAKARLEDARAGTRWQELDRAKAIVEESNQRLHQMQEAVSGAKANLAGARTDMAQAERDLAEKESMVHGGATSTKEVNDARSHFENLRSTVESWESRIREAETQIEISRSTARQSASQFALLQEGQTTQSLTNLDAQVKAALAAADLARAQLDKYTIRALRTGTVQRRLAEPGQVVASGGALLSVLDLQDMWIRVYVPEAQIGRATLGREVTVRADAWPDKKFHGKVVQVNDQAEFTPKNTQTSEERTRLVFGVKVQMLDGTDQLRPGLPADVQM